MTITFIVIGITFLIWLWPLVRYFVRNFWWLLVALAVIIVFGGVFVGLINFGTGMFFSILGAIGWAFSNLHIGWVVLGLICYGIFKMIFGK